ncbi:MAG: hypothetical protein JSV62_12930 [Promethearchaeota archaeon]|nr:MAG: hypothetical protein JSV62_12930 [Candidatus Lokiarchaeota archaeon]
MKEARALLHPNRPRFNMMFKNQNNFEDILEAPKEAGRQLFIEGKMNPETSYIISCELLPLEMYVSPRK